MSSNTISTTRDLKETLERIRSANSYDSAKLAYDVLKNARTGKFIIKKDNSNSAVKTAR